MKTTLLADTSDTQHTSSDSVVFLRGRKTILRPLHKDDIPLLTRWINDPEIRQYVTNTHPITQEMEVGLLAKMTEDKNTIFLIIEADGHAIGSMSLGNIKWTAGIATTGAIIGDKAYWGKGYGTDAKMALLEYAFNVLGLRKIQSGVIAFNKRSLNYSLKCGYVIEGTLRKRFLRGGRYWDEVILGIFRNEWRVKHKLWKHGKL